MSTTTIAKEKKDHVASSLAFMETPNNVGKILNTSTLVSNNTWIIDSYMII